jgi:site-specific DNA-methyltransferase (adenine-specific)/adenine-specific DNA-methyltransferase
MNEELKKVVIDARRRGEDLPREWARELFPPEKREYELVYYDKEREEDIIANTMALPLQPVSTFGKNGDGWHNMLIFGDNAQVIKTLLTMKEEGKLVNEDGTPGVRLIYIDPEQPYKFFDYQEESVWYGGHTLHETASEVGKSREIMVYI